MITLSADLPVSDMRRRLRGHREQLTALRPLYDRLGRMLTAWSERNMDAAGRLLDDAPGGWPPLTPATLARRRQRGLGRRPLIVSGRLRAGFAARQTAAGLHVENVVPYARRHHEGDGVPRRPLLPEAAQAARLVLPLIQRHVREALP